MVKDAKSPRLPMPVFIQDENIVGNGNTPKENRQRGKNEFTSHTKSSISIKRYPFSFIMRDITRIFSA